MTADKTDRNTVKIVASAVISFTLWPWRLYVWRLQ